MKRLILVILFFLPRIQAQTAPASDIEIVESIPAGTILDNPDIRNAHEVWLEMIGRTHITLDIEEFYISHEPGKLLEDVLAAIYSAANRGVKVRVIIDGRMYKTYPASADSLGRYRNIEVRRIDFGSIGGGIQHAKYFIVDGKEVFVGSQNFDWRALEHIHELGLRINSKEFASAYSDVFNLDWQLASLTPEAIKTFSMTRKTYSMPIRVTGKNGDVASVEPTSSPIGWVPDSALWDERAIVGVIDGSQRTLTLQFLSYSPSERRGGKYTVIDDAIRRAAKRGVKVRMIVSDWQKGSLAVTALKELANAPNIEVAFTAIPEWSGGYVSFARVEHCKYIVADESKFWLGTSNCEKSYFYSTRNMGVVCSSPTLAATLAKIFLRSWNSPYKELITQNGEYPQREHGERK
ncbi:MAG: phospholipase D-like domain-containing protein [Ignavibacteriales bacterium]|nr:phospholipase D-like domain-containing protein [Ignavibacteriales bacterium]